MLEIGTVMQPARNSRKTDRQAKRDNGNVILLEPEKSSLMKWACQTTFAASQSPDRA
jgi:hypothetical protein